MSWSQGQAGNANFASMNQNSYRGMVKVLPTSQLPAVQMQYLHRPITTITASESFNPTTHQFNANTLSEHRYRLQVGSNFTSQANVAIPKLPPPPLPLRVNKSQRSERNQKKRSHSMSVHDLRQVGNSYKSQQPLVMSPNSLYDKRSLTISVQDLRQRELRPIGFQLSERRPNDSSNQQGVLLMSANRPQEPCVPKVQAQVQQSYTISPPLNKESAAVTRSNQAISEMSSLHDEMVKLKLELAAMRDPMQEHEQWLKSQSAQVKELEQLQKQLHSSITINSQDSKNGPSSNPFRSLPVSPVQKVALPTSKSTKPSIVVLPVPVKPIRPPVTSPKPIPQKPHSCKKHGGSVKKSNLEVTDNADLSNINSSEKLKLNGLIAKQVQEPEKSVARSSLNVKRISQLFEANADISYQRGSHDAQDKNGNVKKLSPTLLRTIQISEEAKMPSRSLPSKVGANDVRARYSMASPSNVPPPLSPKPIVVPPPSQKSVVTPSVPPPSTSISPLHSNLDPSPPNVLTTTFLEPIHESSQNTPAVPALLPTAQSVSKDVSLTYSPKITSSVVGSSDAAYFYDANPHSDDNLIHADLYSPSFPSIPSPFMSPRYENIQSALDTHFSQTVVASGLPHEPTKNLHRYAQVPGELEYQDAPDLSYSPPPLPPKDYLTDQLPQSYSSSKPEASFLNNSSFLATQAEIQVPKVHFVSPQALTEKESDSIEDTVNPKVLIDQDKVETINPLMLQPTANVVIRPTTPPPPPPIPTLTELAPPLPFLSLTANSSHDNRLGPSSPQVLPPPAPDENTSKEYSGSSGKSSLSSVTGIPLTPSQTATKADLMEQIRLFKESGKGLKRASLDMSETPTRVRKNSMQDALQTRFEAFCGTASDSSDEEVDHFEDDWD